MEAEIYETIFQERDYRSLDALYYWALCLGSSGARLSFYLKYGTCTVYDEIIEKLHSRIPEGEIYNFQISIVKKLESLTDFCITLEQDVANRCKRLSEDARRFAKILIMLDIPRSLRFSTVEQLQLSSSINLIAKKIFRQHTKALSIIFELIGAGLLITCCWAQYEGFPHMYTVPIYSLQIWKKLTH